MKILILTNYFPPEIGAASHLLYEMAERLVEDKHVVTVVTGFPRYNVQQINPNYCGKLLYKEKLNGIKVLRVRTFPILRDSKIGRGLEHISVPAIFALRGLFCHPHDVIFVYSPPLPLGVSALLLRRFKGSAVVVNVQDLFPKSVIDLGILKNSLLIRFFEIVESFIYKKVDHITVHSLGNLKYILEHGGHPKRVSVLYNWVDTNKIIPGDRNNEFAQQHSLTDFFVISYAGNMGWCQDTSIIVQTAVLLKNYKNILFLMVGDGVEKDHAVQCSGDLGLENIKWLPMQPWKIYPQILAASNISMINLKQELQTPVVPSKLINIMAAGIPVVASLPLDGDAPRIIGEAKAGLCVKPNDPEGLASAILQLYHNRELCQQYGHNGRSYVQAHFSKEKCVDQYVNIFRKLIR